MNSVVVDIADLTVSKDVGDCLITYSLGSCIGVAVWDPVARVGGLLHFMLPESRLCPDKARANPAMFCDTGVAKLLNTAYESGAVQARLVIKVAGGGQLLGENGTLNIGQRNYAALQRVLGDAGLRIAAEDVGDSICRTLRLDIGTGLVIVRARQQEVPL